MCSVSAKAVMQRSTVNIFPLSDSIKRRHLIIVPHLLKSVVSGFQIQTGVPTWEESLKDFPSNSSSLWGAVLTVAVNVLTALGKQTNANQIYSSPPV